MFEKWKKSADTLKQTICLSDHHPVNIQPIAHTQSGYSEEQAIKVFLTSDFETVIQYKSVIKSIINHNYNELSRVILKQ